MVTRYIASLAVSAAALIVVACSGARDKSTDDSSSSLSGFHGSTVHVMKVHPPSKQRAQLADAPGPAGAKLNYFGGPVISNVKVYAVYWNSHVQFQDHINAFYPAITNSAYFDWLSEYNTPTQQIGRGSFGGAVVDTNAPSGNTIKDSQIQAEIGKLIDAGKLPPNDGDNVYMVYFPPGVTITGPQGAGTSCQEFCAYHGTFTKNDKFAYYGVMPDLGGACSSGCGDGSPEDNITEVSSHELIEAVTDGAVGEATTDGPPLAWYDDTNGEIGDICVGHGTQVAGFTVQLEWSNKLKLCTATGGGSAGDGGAAGDGGGATGDSGASDGGVAPDGASSGSTCAHALCSTGAKLGSTCDFCVDKVCARDFFCCDVGWDDTCVEEVTSICNQTCN